MKLDLQLFAENDTQGAETPAPATATVTIPTIEELKALTKDDLLKLQQDAANFPAAIEQAITEKIQEEADAVKDGIDRAETAVKTWEQEFREKHGVSVWVAVIGGGYIVWQVGSAVLRALEVY